MHGLPVRCPDLLPGAKESLVWGKAVGLEETSGLLDEDPRMVWRTTVRKRAVRKRVVRRTTVQKRVVRK